MQYLRNINHFGQIVVLSLLQLDQSFSIIQKNYIIHFYITYLFQKCANGIFEVFFEKQIVQVYLYKYPQRQTTSILTFLSSFLVQFLQKSVARVLLCCNGIIKKSEPNPHFPFILVLASYFNNVIILQGKKSHKKQCNQSFQF